MLQAIGVLADGRAGPWTRPGEGDRGHAREIAEGARSPPELKATFKAIPVGIWAGRVAAHSHAARSRAGKHRKRRIFQRPVADDDTGEGLPDPASIFRTVVPVMLSILMK